MGKYEEALERAKELHEAGNALTKSQMEIVFPELKESEDEKFARIVLDSPFKHEADYKFVRAYLERQKEQKPAEKQDYDGLTDLERAIHRGFLSAGVENVPVTIIKETAQDCLAHIDKPAEKISVSEELYEHIRNTCACIDDAMSSDTMCDMTDYLTMADSSAQKAFDMVERLVVNKPTECSEEDEDHINSILKRLEGMCKKGATFIQTRFAVSEDKDWLKSLRHKPHWKPSEEQMRCLLDCVSKAKEIHNASVGGYDAYRILVSLYDELHKLL